MSRRAMSLLAPSLLVFVAALAVVPPPPVAGAVTASVVSQSSAVSSRGGPILTVAAPRGLQAGDVLVAFVAGPPAQPDQPITADSTWTPLPEVLHLARFWKVWTEQDPRQYTFRWTPGVPAKTSLALIVALRGAARVSASTQQPICEKAGDVACSGSWHSNPPMIDPPYPAGATDLRALSAPASAGDLVLAGFAVHATALDLRFPSICPPIAVVQSPRRLSKQTGVLLGVCSLVADQDGPSPEVVVHPSATRWAHAMGTQAVLG
jgi:hypothetical protein